MEWREIDCGNAIRLASNLVVRCEGWIHQLSSHLKSFLDIHDYGFTFLFPSPSQVMKYRVIEYEHR